MNNPRAGVARLLEQERLERAASAIDRTLTVFVAGPFIEVDKPLPRGKAKEAARLRYLLYHHLTDLGYLVTLGEFNALIDAHKDVLGHVHNAAFSEIGHAQTKADAIVMLPSSPGSFLELGAFALYENITSKMMIIVNKKYKEEKGYLQLGPLVGAKNWRAEVEYEDYSEFEKCKVVIDRFLMRISQRIMAKEYLPK